MTLDAAVVTAREIQRALDRGELKVPYPVETRNALIACTEVFIAWCNTPARTLELARRLDQREMDLAHQKAELPW